MPKTHIVMPIGVASPGTPVPALLDLSIRGLRQQTSDDYHLTVAADTDISEECKGILRKHGCHIKWFDPHSFFARGGIWKKISGVWKEHESKYIAFHHYDDFWHPTKLYEQVKFMEESDLLGSWSRTIIIDGQGQPRSNDVSMPEMTAATIGTRSAAFPHSCIVNREAFFNCGIMKYEDQWSPIFEEMWALYFHKIKKVARAEEALFYWRNHADNMSNTLCLWDQPNSKWKGNVESQMNTTAYQKDDMESDMHQINVELEAEKEEIRKLYV